MKIFIKNRDLISISFSQDVFFVEADTGDAYSSEDLLTWVPSQHSFSSGIGKNFYTKYNFNSIFLKINKIIYKIMRPTK